MNGASSIPKMLSVTSVIPDGLLDCESEGLADLLSGPTLLHLPGRQTAPLFVSVLLHGNEVTGWLAIRSLLQAYADRELPRALSVFIGNVEAARYGKRLLDGQPDYNRIWFSPDTPASSPEEHMVRQVVEEMRRRNVFGSLDIHNNTGLNPYYGCIRREDESFFYLASLFSRTIVHFLKPEGVQSEAFSDLCPAATLECGRPGDPAGTVRAVEYIEDCMRLTHFPDRPIPFRDIDVYHTAAVVEVPEETSFVFSSNGQGHSVGKFSEQNSPDVVFQENIDRLNFSEVLPGALWGRIEREGARPLLVRNEQGEDVTNRFFSFTNGEIRLIASVMPSMLTLDTGVVRQDCFCYLMERYSPKGNAQEKSS